MTNALIGGFTGLTRVKRLKGIPTANDLVNRTFSREGANKLWITQMISRPISQSFGGPRSKRRGKCFSNNLSCCELWGRLVIEPRVTVSVQQSWVKG